jgi:hypothetical protein
VVYYSNTGHGKTEIIVSKDIEEEDALKLKERGKDDCC